MSFRLPGAPFSSHPFSPFDVQFLEHRRSELRVVASCAYNVGCRVGIVSQYRDRREVNWWQIAFRLSWFFTTSQKFWDQWLKTEKDLWRCSFGQGLFRHVPSVQCFRGAQSKWIWAKYFNLKTPRHHREIGDLSGESFQDDFNSYGWPEWMFRTVCDI